MNLEKMIKNLEIRKNNTKKALEEVYNIFDLINNHLKSNIGVMIGNKSIKCKISYHNGNCWVNFSNGDLYDSEFKLTIRDNELNLYHDLCDTNRIVEKNDIDYINLRELYDALVEIIEKLGNLTTFQEETNNIEILHKTLDSLK